MTYNVASDCVDWHTFCHSPTWCTWRVQQCCLRDEPDWHACVANTVSRMTSDRYHTSDLHSTQFFDTADNNGTINNDIITQYDLDITMTNFSSFFDVPLHFYTAVHQSNICITSLHFPLPQHYLVSCHISGWVRTMEIKISTTEDIFRWNCKFFKPHMFNNRLRVTLLKFCNDA